MNVKLDRWTCTADIAIIRFAYAATGQIVLNISSVTAKGNATALPPESFPESNLDLERLTRAGRRQFWFILLFLGLGLAGGAMYLTRSVPRYTATSVLFFESAKDKSGLSASIADLTYDAGAIDSQLEVLKSEGIALSVLSSLKLDQDQQFLRPPPGVVSQITDGVRSALGLSAAPESAPDDTVGTEAARQRALVRQLQGGLEVRRIGRSYVIDVDYTSTDPEKSAAIANAFAEAYISDQVESRFDAIKRASGWLDKRIGELKQKSMGADLAVQRFKSDHGILTADGRLVSEQQMSELSTQLVLAQSELARANARYDQINGLVQAKDIQGVVSQTLESGVMNDLRQKFLEASRLESNIVATLGPNHPQADVLRRSMDEYSNMMFDEMKRIAAAYKSDLEVARAREGALRQGLADLAAKSAATDQALVQLREMQREADGNRTLYSTFLERLQQVQEKQSFPESEARIITAASPPTAPSYPKRTVIMALSLVFGLLAGVGVGAFREYNDKVFRTAGDVREGLKLELLGMLPLIRSRTLRRRRPSDGLADPREVQATGTILGYSLDQPLTSFSETLRGVKIAVDLNTHNRAPKIVGVVSVSPGEGKSVVSKNFASLVAHLGSRVLLIDGDLHHPGLTTALAGGARDGLLEVVQAQRPFSEVAMLEPASGLLFLPAVVKVRQPQSTHILASSGMRRFIEEVADQFDYIVIDLPPIGPVVDVRAAASMIDAFVLVTEWGRSNRAMVQMTMQAERDIASRCVGVVYNKVQIGKIKLYEGADAKAFHYKEFSRYYNA